MAETKFDYQDSAWVAAVLHLDVAIVEELMRYGELPGFRIGPKWLVSEEMLSQFLKAKEQFGPASSAAIVEAPIAHSATRASRARVTYRLLERPMVEASFKDMLVDVLRTLSSRDKTFLSRFSKERGRKRQYVAQNPADLYPGQPDLVRKFKAEISSGWWVGTNYSATEIEQILRKAARVAKLRWGRDIAIETEGEAERKRRAMSIIGIASDPDPDASIRHDDLFAETILNE